MVDFFSDVYHLDVATSAVLPGTVEISLLICGSIRGEWYSLCSASTRYLAKRERKLVTVPPGIGFERKDFLKDTLKKNGDFLVSRGLKVLGC